MEYCDSHTKNAERITAVEESVKTAHRRITDVEGIVEKHDDKLEALCSANASNINSIQNLCEKIDGLVSTIKWFIGLAVSICGLLVGILTIRG